MAEIDLNNVPDGGALRTLASGLIILRRKKKHEWHSSYANWDKDQRVNRTNKEWGSKFLAEWDIRTLTDWIQEQVEAAGWTLELQEPCPLFVDFPRDIGIAKGKSVRRIKIVCDGRHIHAYPVKG